jgi:hypothetical protein
MAGSCFSAQPTQLRVQTLTEKRPAKRNLTLQSKQKCKYNAHATAMLMQCNAHAMQWILKHFEIAK